MYRPLCGSRRGLFFWENRQKPNGGENHLPSEKVLQDKQEFVAKLAEKLDGSVAGVVVNYQGITVADDTALRKKLREAGVDYAVVKNTMLRRAAEKVGLNGLDSVLEGATALAGQPDRSCGRSQNPLRIRREEQEF